MAVALLVAVAACSNSAASADSQTSNDSMANQQPDSALTLVKFETSAGDFVVELFNDAPIHRDNFIKLVLKCLELKSQQLMQKQFCLL